MTRKMAYLEQRHLPRQWNMFVWGGFEDFQFQKTHLWSRLEVVLMRGYIVLALLEVSSATEKFAHFVVVVSMEASL